MTNGPDATTIILSKECLSSLRAFCQSKDLKVKTTIERLIRYLLSHPSQLKEIYFPSDLENEGE